MELTAAPHDYVFPTWYGKYNGAYLKNGTGILRILQLIVAFICFITVEATLTCYGQAGTFGYYGFISLFNIGMVVIFFMLSICSMYQQCPNLSIPVTLLWNDALLSITNILAFITVISSIGDCKSGIGSAIALLILSGIETSLFIYSTVLDFRLKKEVDAYNQQNYQRTA